MRRHSAPGAAIRSRRKRAFINVERLESRLAMSGAQAAWARTIMGTITNDANGRGLGHVGVELIASNGQTVAWTHTGPRGNYRFQVRYDGPYVIHAVAPRGFAQTSPTFTFSEPTGEYATNPATGQPYNGSNWSYHTGNDDPANGPVGPAAWSTIAQAGARPFEAPINITGAPIDLSQYLTINYADSKPSAVVNNGAQIQVQFPSTASTSITLDGQAFQLSQFHFHDASENQVDGHTYPMEEHFVNVSSSGAITAVAVFLELGAHNAALQPILDAATANLTTADSTTTLDSEVDFAGLLPDSMQGWFFEGSLTTPPLAGPINFLVFSTPITLDYQQLMQYEKVASGSGFLLNNRPIQPTDGRQVNQFNINVDFQGQSLSSNNFTFSRLLTSAGSNASAASAAAHAPTSAYSTPLVVQSTPFRRGSLRSS